MRSFFIKHLSTTTDHLSHPLIIHPSTTQYTSVSGPLGISPRARERRHTFKLLWDTDSMTVTTDTQTGEKCLLFASHSLTVTQVGHVLLIPSESLQTINHLQIKNLNYNKMLHFPPIPWDSHTPQPASHLTRLVKNMIQSHMPWHSLPSTTTQAGHSNWKTLKTNYSTFGLRSTMCNHTPRFPKQYQQRQHRT